MRKSLAILLAVVGMACLANAQTASPAFDADPPANAGMVTASLSALPLAPVSLADGMPSAITPVSSIVPSSALAPIVAVTPAERLPSTPKLPGKHPFFDKTNLGIFASVLAVRTMDPISTWQFRRHGLHESELSDGFVDNKPLFAAYSASLVAGQISASYAFHRLGWHKMERITAVIHTAVVTQAVIHNYRIGTKH